MIIFADVLEHLVDPWGVLRELRPMLSPGGRVLLSVPNIAHWTARAQPAAWAALTTPTAT